MDRIIKTIPCSLQVWCGSDEPIINEGNFYFDNKNEVKEYLNERLQAYKGQTIECYVYQYHKGRPHETPVYFEVK